MATKLPELVCSTITSDSISDLIARVTGFQNVEAEYVAAINTIERSWLTNTPCVMVFSIVTLEKLKIYERSKRGTC